MYYVYVIWARDEDGEEVRYYGHTHDMEERKDHHVQSYNAWVRAGRPVRIHDSGQHGCRSVFVLDMGDWKIEVLHELDCDQEEASRVEGNYIRYNKCVNRSVPGRTRQQHYQDNRDSLLQKQRQYYYDNRETLNSKKAEKVSCPCGTLVRRSDISTHLKSKKHAKRMQQSTSSS